MPAIRMSYWRLKYEFMNRTRMNNGRRVTFRDTAGRTASCLRRVNARVSEIRAFTCRSYTSYYNLYLCFCFFFKSTNDKHCNKSSVIKEERKKKKHDKLYSRRFASSSDRLCTGVRYALSFLNANYITGRCIYGSTCRIRFRSNNASKRKIYTR